MLNIKTSLFGIRYYMREWFFSFALLTIGIMSTILFLSTMVFYLIVKESIKNFLINL